MSTYQLKLQVRAVWEAYERSGTTEPYEDYLESFYANHDNAHIHYSKEVRNQLKKDVTGDNMRRRLRKKLQAKRDAEAKAKEEALLKQL